MSDYNIDYFLPIANWPKATFKTDYLFQGGTLCMETGDPKESITVLQAANREALELGISTQLPDAQGEILVQLEKNAHGDRFPTLTITVNGVIAKQAKEMTAPTSRSAWIHGWIAVAASAAGFVSSYLYLLRAEALPASEAAAWAYKMGVHTAGWHLLLTFTLFPASVWGQQIGIRCVQGVSIAFLLIHVGMSVANLWPAEQQGIFDQAIALFNALSGFLFLLSVIYGNRAHKEMDPIAALRHT